MCLLLSQFKNHITARREHEEIVKNIPIKHYFINKDDIKNTLIIIRAAFFVLRVKV